MPDMTSTRVHLKCREMGLHVQTALELHCARLLRTYEGDVVIAEAQCLDIARLNSVARRTVSHVMVDFYLVSVRPSIGSSPWSCTYLSPVHCVEIVVQSRTISAKRRCLNLLATTAVH